MRDGIPPEQTARYAELARRHGAGPLALLERCEALTAMAARLAVYFESECYCPICDGHEHKPTCELAALARRGGERSSTISRLDDLERMAREGTARPWEVTLREQKNPHGEAPSRVGSVRVAKSMPVQVVVRLDFGYGSDNDAATAALIVAAVNSLSSLLAIARAAQAWRDASDRCAGAVEQNEADDALAAALGEFERGGGK